MSSPTAAASSSASSTLVPEAEKRKLFTAFYEKYAPTEMAKLEDEVKSQLPISKLFEMLRERYKIDPSTTDPIALGVDPASADDFVLVEDGEYEECENNTTSASSASSSSPASAQSRGRSRSIILTRAEFRKGADWMPDESSKSCVRCKKEFGLFTRKHHCYCDGRLLCADCTPSKCVIPAEIGGTSKNEVRVCSECKDWIDQRGSGKGIVLRGELFKAYQDSVLGFGSSLSKTQIEKLKTVTLLAEYFISGKDARFKKSTSLDLSMFISVHEVGNGFLSYCSSLKSVDLSALTSLSIIGYACLYQCSALTSLTLPSVSKITSVPDYFLYQCSSLTAINNMSALSQVSTVGEYFVSGCSSLTSVDLSELTSLSSIGSQFLYQCSRLTSVSLPSVSKITVQHVGNCLLEDCEQLCFDKEVLAPLLRASNIKDEWLQQVASGEFLLAGELLKAYEAFVLGGSSLSSLQLSKLKLVTVLPDNFISAAKDARFKKITSIDFSMFIAVREIGEWFLHDCSSLQSIDLTPLSNVTSVSSHFLYRCSGLQSIDLNPLSNVTFVSSYFLSGCSSLQSIDLKPFSNVTSVASCFLYGCSSLQSIDLKPLSNVTSVSSYFLSYCSKLTQKEYLDQVDLTPLLNIPDGKIEIRQFEDKENNLKTALQRVRAGGANGGPHKCVAPTSSPTSASSSSSYSSSNSSGVAPAPTQKRDENDEGEENRQGRFDFDQEFETDQFDVALDLPVFSSSYTPVHSARDAYVKVIGAIIGSNSSQMTLSEVSKLLGFLQRKTDLLLQTVGKQHGQTQDEVFAIVAYSADVRSVNPALGAEHNFYHRLNSALGMRATNDFSNHSPLLDLFCHFVTGLRKIPAEKNVTVYRAVSKGLAELSTKGAYEKVGTSICWPAFTSTSLDPKVSLGFVTKAQKGASLMKITVSAAYPIIEYSQYAYEKELLLLPNSVVKIDAVRSAVPRTASEITCFKFTGTLPNTIDVVEMSQQERDSSQEDNLPSSPRREVDVRELEVEELETLLKKRKVNPKLIAFMKENEVTGAEFAASDEWVQENIPQGTIQGVLPGAYKYLTQLHGELCGFSSSSSSPTSSSSTSATAASY